jgi:hypothetical protein
LENFDNDAYINKAWESISAKVSIGHQEIKKHKPLFDEGSSDLLNQSKQAKL